MRTFGSSCQECGARLPAASPGGLCPACLMGGAVDLLKTGMLSTDLPAPPDSGVTKPDALEGTELGIGNRYKILQRIGEGGFGTVYMAEQLKPVRRRVAVKVLKAGMDTRQVVARFEAERQALAMMDHPNIAKILDGGETEQGRSFFVMELVRGTPITTFCDREKLDTNRRLELFIQVCRAVQHAHQKGIIHRDLKPGNILVTMPDGAEPIPKVIDFGVAKAIESNLTDKTLFTRFEQMIGTPSYMSPEQAGAEGTHDIDTRADIYALGVLLYELLTGTTPFEASTLQNAAFEEVRRILREEEAPRPSARLGSLKLERQTSIAKERGTESGILGKQLRGDLDWIVMKAIEKDRRRRYETASVLAMDVERNMRNEPIEARPPTAGYRLQKFAGRNKSLLTTIAIVAGALVTATIISTWSAIRAADSERLATERLDQVENERDDKEAARKEAEIQKNEAIWNQYVARQFPIMEAWRNRNFGRVDSLLTRQVPADNQPDYRGWEWAYMRNQCDQAFTTIDARLPAWHPTQRSLAVVSGKDGSEAAIELRSPDDGTLLRTIASIPLSPQSEMRILRWSADGALLAYLMSSGEIGVLDAASGEHVFKVDIIGDSGGEERMRVFDLSADGTLIATGSWSGRIELWDVVSGTRIRILHDPESISHLESLQFNSTMDHLAAALRFGRRTTWDLATGKAFNYEQQSLKNGRVAWDPSGTRFVATDADSFALFEVNRAEPLKTFPHQSVNQVAWIGDAQIASSGFDQTIRIWDVTDSEQPGEFLLTDGPAWHLSASADEELLAIETTVGTTIFELDHRSKPGITLTPDVTMQGSRHPIAWNRNGRHLASGHLEYHGTNKLTTTLRIWDAHKESLVQQQSPKTILCGLGWNPDHTAVLATGHEGALQQMMLRSHRLRSVRNHMASGTDGQMASISLNGRWLAYGNDQGVSLIDTASMQTVRSIETPKWASSVARWSHDDRLVALGLWGEILIWDPLADQVTELHDAGEQIFDFAWNPSNLLLALGMRTGEIQIRRTDTLDVVARLFGHRGEVAGIDWAEHGRIATAGGDGTVRIWDGATGHELLVFPHPEKTPFLSVRWSPDGRRLAAGDVDGRVLIWGSNDLKPLQGTQSLTTGVMAKALLSATQPLQMGRQPPSETIARLRAEISDQTAALTELRREPEALDLGLALVSLAELHWRECGEGWQESLAEADGIFKLLLDRDPNNSDQAFSICETLLARWALTPERLRRAEEILFPSGIEPAASNKSPVSPALWLSLIAAYERFDQQAKVLHALQAWSEVEMRDSASARAELIKEQNRLIVSYANLEQWDRAIELGEQALTLRQNFLGVEHKETVSAMLLLAEVYHYSERKDEALSIHEKVLNLRIKISGPESPLTRQARHILADSYESTGRIDEALVLDGGGHLPLKPDSPAAAAVLIPPSSKWRWLHPVDGVDPGDVAPGFHQHFFRADYDDSGWQSGLDSGEPTGGFGYGDEGFTGVDIGTPAEKALGKSAYFRHQFTSDKEYTNLELRCHRDDGIIVYLDGVEVVCDNMSEGDDAYLLPAQWATVDAAETTIFRFPLKGLTLPAGEHIVAISLHNTEAPSSDLRIGAISLVSVKNDAEDDEAGNNE